MFIIHSLKVLIVVFIILYVIGLLNKPYSVYSNDQSNKNPFEGKTVEFIYDDSDDENADGSRGHLIITGNSSYKPSFYEKYTKRFIDILLSFLGIVLLSPLLLILCVALYIDDPGPILFTQKRVGRNKQFFRLHKFRSMKMSTPHDVPTHMLENPEQYITKVGKFIRKTSLDELPQIWDIFIGNMSIIGPRPALWNQDVLTALRDKYNANCLRPGLTGWAQINGRDELELEDKAKLDGDYTKILNKGKVQAFIFDFKCFFGTILSVIKKEGVVEGRHGTKFYNPINPNDGKTTNSEDDYQIKE